MLGLDLIRESDSVLYVSRYPRELAANDEHIIGPVEVVDTEIGHCDLHSDLPRRQDVLATST